MEGAPGEEQQVTNAGRTRIPDAPRGDIGHKHKFASAREHRMAHKRERQEVERARVRAIARHPQRRRVVRSEWLDRSPEDNITARGFKQPGRNFGPAAIGSGLGPRETGRPMSPAKRLGAYARQNRRVLHGNFSTVRLTPRQARRARQKARTGAKKDA